MATPNIVIIITDDQPVGMLGSMPNTVAEIQNKGVTVTAGVSPSPLCGMSRAALLCGRYAGHSLGIWDNGGADGGWKALQPYEGQTIAVELQNKGWRTGMFGKYTNSWSRNNPEGNPPPGWDRFRAITAVPSGDGAYYDYYLRGTGPDEYHGTAEADYSTDVIATDAVQFIKNTPEIDPLFLYFSPYGVHAPYGIAPRHIGTYNEEVVLPPSVNHPNDDKAPWTHVLSNVNEDNMRDIIRQQHESVMSIDDAIGRIVTSLTNHNRIDNTLFIFFGDNGYQLGRHQIRGKYVPYEASTNLETLFRWDGHFLPGSTSDRVTPTMDITATIAEACCIKMPASDGIPFPAPRTGCLLEGGNHTGTTNYERPSYIGWRTKDHMWVRYGGGFEEFYDYTIDPYELVNEINNPTYAAEIAAYTSLAMAEANPRPPGWF